jgi:hypothetical protein
MMMLDNFSFSCFGFHSGCLAGSPPTREEHKIFNLLPSNWHVPIVLPPENLRCGIAVHRAVELHCLAHEDARVGWNLLERWLDCKKRRNDYSEINLYAEKFSSCSSNNDDRSAMTRNRRTRRAVAISRREISGISLKIFRIFRAQNIAR